MARGPQASQHAVPLYHLAPVTVISSLPNNTQNASAHSTACLVPLQEWDSRCLVSWFSCANNSNSSTRISPSITQCPFPSRVMLETTAFQPAGMHRCWRLGPSSTSRGRRGPGTTHQTSPTPAFRRTKPRVDRSCLHALPWHSRACTRRCRWLDVDRHCGAGR